MSHKIIYSVIQKPLVERLEDAACIYWSVDAEFFRQKNRDELSTNKRHILFYLLRMDAGINAYNIAARYGYRQASINESVEIIDFRRSNSRSIADDMKNIREIAAKLEARIIQVDVKLEQFLGNQNPEREQ